jgi:hypothetical protein
MRYRVLRLVTLATLLSGLVPTRLWSHSMYQAAVLFDFHGTTADLEVQLPAERFGAPPPWVRSINDLARSTVKVLTVLACISHER